MSRHGEIILQWGDAERTFRLGLGEWRQVQERCDAGPEELAARLAFSVEAVRRRLGVLDAAVVGLVGRYRIDDVREPIYRGLVGGGADPTAAARLMGELFDGRPIRENVPLAYAIVMASVEGVADEPGEPAGETGTGAPSSPAASSASPTTSAAAPRSATRRRKSTR